MSEQWEPDQYARFRSERAAPFFDLLSLVDREALPPEGARVVDLGCGTGELTAVAHERLGARATTGIDSSPAMLADATARAQPSLSFVAGDLAEYPSAGDEAVDLVLANASLQWVPDHAAVLTGWVGALRPNGQLAVQVPTNWDHPSHLVAGEVAHEPQFADAFALALAGGVPMDPVREHVLRPEVYAQLLEDLGFEHQHVRLQVYGHRLATTGDVVEWVKGTSLTRFKAPLGDALYDAFLARYRTRLLEVLGDRAPFFYPFKRILFWGRLGTR
jgi:trans-aconitate 2-methyltransferase